MSVPQRVCLVCSPRPHWAEQADQGDQRCRPGSWQGCVLHGYVSSDTPASAKIDLVKKSTNYSTGVDFMVRSGFREYEEEKLHFPACCRQENATFSPHIHGTHGTIKSIPVYFYRISRSNKYSRIKSCLTKATEATYSPI